MLSEAITRHIQLYRSMGFKYRVQEYMLHSFGDFAKSRSEDFIRTDTVLEWAASAPSLRQRHDRLLTIRRLVFSAAHPESVGLAISWLWTKSIVFCELLRGSPRGDRYGR